MVANLATWWGCYNDPRLVLNSLSDLAFGNGWNHFKFLAWLKSKWNKRFVIVGGDALLLRFSCSQSLSSNLCPINKWYIGQNYVHPCRVSTVVFSSTVRRSAVCMPFNRSPFHRSRKESRIHLPKGRPCVYTKCRELEMHAKSFPAQPPSHWPFPELPAPGLAPDRRHEANASVLHPRQRDLDPPIINTDDSCWLMLLVSSISQFYAFK